MELLDYEKKHYDFVRNSAGECCVLLKSNGEFPLEKPCKIAAFGNGVRHTIKGGTGSGEVNSHFSINIEEGLKNAGFEVVTGNWLDEFTIIKNNFINDCDKKFEEELEKAGLSQFEKFAAHMGYTVPEPEYDLPLNMDADIAIYVVARNSGEGADRKAIKGDVLLTDSEVRDILYLNKAFKKFMLVLNVGGVVDLTPVKDVNNILLLSQLGVVNGEVLADILLGKQNPSGKLASTWASVDDYSKIGDFGNEDDTYYKEGIYVGYRYFNSVNKKPLFSFGYGLSYTSFNINTTKLEVNKDEVTLNVDVTNTGKLAGKEVVEVYVSCPSGKLDKVYQDLVAFNKTKLLEPNEVESLTLSFNLEDLASYDEEIASYILEKGNYIVRVGNSSDNTKVVGIINLDETVTTLKTKNVLGKSGFDDFVAEKINEEDYKDVPIYNACAKDIEYIEVVRQKEEINDFVTSLTDEELALMCVGNHDPNAKGFASIIGSASVDVAGAAGETSHMLKEKGVKQLVMADGPAGVRLAQDYFKDENGAHSVSSVASFMKGVEVPEGVEIKHQYATAIPIGSAIAQSFNTELAHKYGDIVGYEMKLFGVHLWLAPALNIHRSILCGRNFEYYSEDPLISGKMASAITLGVQQHEGCGTTIKHYAGNNQETNRMGNCDHVSERAFREIYLKGFGICVKESKPCAVMSSYNLINGVHTSEHYGLLNNILRDEFGFDGIVMTDWVVFGSDSPKFKYKGACAKNVSNAGGDLFMPGCKFDYEGVLETVKENRKQIEINVSRTINMINRLTSK